MVRKFEYENKLLIINPTQNDFKELRVNFVEENAKPIYLAQIREVSDENSYDTFVFYEKNGKTFSWHEFENPQHASYFTNDNELKIEEYFKILHHYDKLTGDSFFKKAFVDYNYQNLEKEIPTKEIMDNTVKVKNKI